MNYKKLIQKLELALRQPERYRADPEDPRRYMYPYRSIVFRTGSDWIVGLFCNRSKTYLQRWALSRILTFGQQGESEGIINTFWLQSQPRFQWLHEFVVSQTTNRKTTGLLETYETCRELKPLWFPKLPDVRNPVGAPNFEVLTHLAERKPVQPRNRVRTPSSVGTRQGHGPKTLPLPDSAGKGVLEFEELFLQILSLHNPVLGNFRGK